MEIHIPSEERLRVSTNGKTIFADVDSAPFQRSLTVEFYNFQKQQIRFKMGVFKMFIFLEKDDISDFDFGFWDDAEIVWKSY